MVRPDGEQSGDSQVRIPDVMTVLLAEYGFFAPSSQILANIRGSLPPNHTLAGRFDPAQAALFSLFLPEYVFHMLDLCRLRGARVRRAH
jgi:hypothetical protein